MSSAYYALILIKGRGGMSITETTKVMHMDISCDVSMFRDKQIIPVMIYEQGKLYKLTEARVIKREFTHITVELHIKEGQSFNPIFTMELMDVDVPVVKCQTYNDVRQIQNYLDYDSVQSLHIGSHYNK